jgi:hypothetical protein
MNTLVKFISSALCARIDGNKIIFGLLNMQSSQFLSAAQQLFRFDKLPQLQPGVARTSVLVFRTLVFAQPNLLIE